MSKIDSIKNITIYQDLGTASDFYQKFNINNQPDECIIRNVSYSGPTATDVNGTYMIWSDMINDYICSFSIDASPIAGKVGHNVNISPQTKVHFKQPINFTNNIHFVVYRIEPGITTALPSLYLSGEIAISIDFITYKK